MNRLLRFPNPRAERDEAGQWLARIDRGLSREEYVALGEWLRDPRRREALFRLARAWDGMAVLEELAELFPLRAHEGFAWRPLAAIAAGIALVVMAGVIFWWQRSGADRTPVVAAQHAAAPVLASHPLEPPFTADYTTAVGAHRAVELPDHSRVQLNTNTALRVQYTAHQRLLVMQHGEAMFNVAKDPGRVFTVRVGGYDFNAVGTAFDIRADAPGRLRLTVTEGRVLVRRENDDQSSQAPEVGTDVVVEANKAVSIGRLSERIDALTSDEVLAATAWQRGVLVFKDTPLQQVVAELGRYSSTPFVIAEPKLGQIPVSGYFNVEDMDGLAAALQQNIGIRITRERQYFLLSSAAPPQ